MAPPSNEIYAATYSNVPVYEMNIGGNHVMRRRKDDYVNATHILKVADYDKPARTRILEREVQKGIHEKIQGGYGKYQGTWIPLPDAVLLAKRNNVYDSLRPIFDYTASDVSPPPAPKHSTAQSKPKVPKVPGVKKAPRVSNVHLTHDDYDNMSNPYRDDDSQDNETIETSSYMEGDDGYGSQYLPGSRKRKRGLDLVDQQHTVFADALLDYFILSSTETQLSQSHPPPAIPPSFEINRPIDDQGHTALHWAVAMGDMDLVRTLVDRGASIVVRNKRGETPLIRAVVFTNNYEKNTMQSVVELLRDSITHTDLFNASALHHTVMTTNSRLRRKSAQYYLNTLLENFGNLLSHEDFDRLVNLQDSSGGDTALHIAARHDAKKCVKVLQRFGAHSDIINRAGETADQLCTSLQAVQHENFSSSPPPMDMDLTDGTDRVRNSPIIRYRSESARTFSRSFEGIAQEKSLQVALAIENDFKDRDATLAEARQALEKLDQDIAITQQEAQRYSSQETSNDNEEETALEAEYAMLVGHGQAYSEQQQHRELHSSIRDAERQLPAHIHADSALEALTDTELEERIQAGLELASEQKKRRQLTADVVEGRALAGMSAHGEALKRLVAETTGSTIDEVSALAPELLDALQESKADYTASLALVV